MNVVDFNFQAALCASRVASVQKLSIYLPNKDKHHNIVPDMEKWVRGAVKVLTDINGGSTRMPVAKGTWKEDDDSEVIYEETTIVYSYIEDSRKFISQFHHVAAFVHKFGRETMQGAVMVEFSGGGDGYFVSRAYKVREKDYLVIKKDGDGNSENQTST